jgi:hypothetical protein
MGLGLWLIVVGILEDFQQFATSKIRYSKNSLFQKFVIASFPAGGDPENQSDNFRLGGNVEVGRLLLVLRPPEHTP